MPIQVQPGCNCRCGAFSCADHIRGYGQAFADLDDTESFNLDLGTTAEEGDLILLFLGHDCNATGPLLQIFNVSGYTFRTEAAASASGTQVQYLALYSRVATGGETSATVQYLTGTGSGPAIAAAGTAVVIRSTEPSNDDLGNFSPTFGAVEVPTDNHNSAGDGAGPRSPLGPLGAPAIGFVAWHAGHGISGASASDFDLPSSAAGWTKFPVVTGGDNSKLLVVYSCLDSPGEITNITNPTAATAGDCWACSLSYAVESAAELTE